MGSATENRKINIYINGKQVANNMKTIRGEYRKANNELNKMTIGTKEYIDKTAEIKKLKGVMDNHRKGVFGAQKAWGQLKGVMLGVVGGNLIQTGLQKIGQFIPDLINRAAGLSDVMADVQKTSGLTKTEVNQLNKELRNFDTRTPRKELLALAVEGGRLGKDTVRDLSDFVKVADQIKVALGDDLGGNGEEAIRMVGKLTEQYQVGSQYQTQFGESMLKLGSGINEVSASGANQASFLIDYMKRLSGVSGQAGIAASSTLGYAAALDEAGQAVEVSGTTMGKVMVNMFKDSATYADIAGVKHADFAELLKTDSNEALLLFLKGLNGNNEGLGVMSAKMDKLGLDGARSITVLSALAANTDNIRAKQEIANKAMDEGISLTNEFNVKNDNLAGTYEKLGKHFSKMWTNSSLVQGIETVINKIYSFIEVPMTEKMEKDRISMRALELQIYSTNTPSEKRVELINELKAAYPNFLGYIDAETASNQGLKIAMKAVNDALVNKIILQGKEEVIQQKAQQVAEATEEQLLKEQKMRETLVKYSEKYNLPLKDNLSLLEQSTRMSEIFLNAWEKGGATDQKLYNLGKGLEGSASGLIRAQKEVVTLRTELDDLTQQRTDFQNNTRPVDPSQWVHHDAAWKAAQKKKEEVVVVGDQLSETELENLRKKYEDFEKKQKAMRKRLGFGEFDDSEKNDIEIEPIVSFDDPQEDVVRIFGDDKLFEQEMDNLYDREMAKADLIKEIDEATRKELHTSKEAEALINHLILLERAQVEGLDVTQLQRQIREDEAALEESEFLTRVEKFEQFYGAVKQVAGAYFSWQAAKNEALLIDSQRRTQREIELVQNRVKGDVFSQQQADEQIAKIKEKARQREARIKLDQWRKERAANLIEVGIQTALAIIKAAPNVPLQIAAGVTGAASTAAILAAKEPQFAFGTNNAPGGSALVGEFGPERVNLPKGSEVIPATETADLLSDEKNAQLSIGEGGSLGGSTEVLNELRAMRTILGNLPHVVKGDWRIDEFDAALRRKERNENVTQLG